MMDSKPEDNSPFEHLIYKPTIVEENSAQALRKMKMKKETGEKCTTCLKNNLLTVLTMMSVVVGVGLGFALRARPEPWTKREIMYISFPGDLFLRMLKCLILPLIISSLVSALGGLDLRISGKIGVRAVVYYMATTLIAVTLGIILVNIIHPGAGEPDIKETVKKKQNITTVDTLMDLVRNMFPPNLVEACIFQYRTALEHPLVNGSQPNESQLLDLKDWNIQSENVSGMNIMGLVVFSVFLGLAIGRMEERAKPLQQFFSALSETMMLITKWVIWLTPIGITFLITGKILDTEDFGVIAGQLGMYTVTVLCGLGIHGLIILPLIFTVTTKTLPFKFIYNLMQALSTAFGTSSSTATLPITVTCLEEKNNIDRRVARFVLPIGATINMDGTALYEAVAALFIAQVRHVPMDIGKIIAISITATAASIGAAGIPQAGLVTMVMVLNTVGLAADDVTLIIMVDWFLDRFRTTVNVLGDSLGAGIVDHLSKKELEMLDAETEMGSSGNPGSPRGSVREKNGNIRFDEELECQTTSM